MKKLFFIISLFTLFNYTPYAFAETQRNIRYLPSEERNTIMDIVTKATALSLKANTTRMQLGPQLFKRSNEWIFLSADIKDISGGSFDYTGTEWDGAEEAGVYPSNMVVALLKKKGLKWILLDISVNFSDVAWGDWDKQHNAPTEILDFMCLSRSKTSCEVIYEIPYMWHGEWHPSTSGPPITIGKQHMALVSCGKKPRKVQAFFIFGGMVLELEEGYCHYNGKSISHFLFKQGKNGKPSAGACPIEISFYESVQQLSKGKSSYRNTYTKSDCLTFTPQ